MALAVGPTDFCGVTVALAVTETLAGYSHKDTIITIAGRRQQLPRHDTVKGDTPKKKVWTKGSEAADRSSPKKQVVLTRNFLNLKTHIYLVLFPCIENWQPI